ncbi:hypothetical protein GC163_03845 [bacterium]|nr:hypothetical protein [bacterium]
MDCSDTLEWLEAAELGQATAADTEVVQARQHLTTCPVCQQEWPARKSWALQLAASISDVPIPSGLRERLLADVPMPAAVSTTAVHPRRSSRRWVLMSALCLTLLVGLLQFWPQPQPPLTLVELQQGLSVELAGLPEFRGDFDPHLPAIWATSFDFDRSFVRGYPPHGMASGQVALIPFQYPLAGQPEPVKGRLLILPRQRFAESQRTLATQNFRQAQVQYFRGLPGAFLVWSEDDLIYVCLMPGDPEHLARFQRSLAAPRSLT